MLGLLLATQKGQLLTPCFPPGGRPSELLLDVRPASGHLRWPPRSPPPRPLPPRPPPLPSAPSAPLSTVVAAAPARNSVLVSLERECLGSSAPSPSALTVSSVSAALYGSGRRPGEKLRIGIVGAGVLRVLGFVERRQGAGHQFILLETVGDVEMNYRNSGWYFLT